VSNTFEQFCSRKWLDYCDENKTAQSVFYTEKEFKKHFNKWLLKKYADYLILEKENT